MTSRRLAVAMAGAIAVTIAVGVTLISAANPTSQLPAEKQAQVDNAKNFQQGGPNVDKTKAHGGPNVVQGDPPPDTGLLGAAGAPMPAAEFTTVNAWAGWTDATTYVQVFAGGPGADLKKGSILVIRRQGHGGLLDSGVTPVVNIVPALNAAGPLRIVRIEDGQLIVMNPGGHELRFNPASGAFD